MSTAASRDETGEDATPLAQADDAASRRTSARVTAASALALCALFASAAAVAEPFQQDPTTGLVSMEVENVDGNTSQGGHSWVPGSLPGASGSASMVTTPNSGTNRNGNYLANGPRLDYQVNFLEAGTYYVWIRGQGPSLADDSVHAGVDGAGPATADRISYFSNGGFSWSSDTMDGSRATIDIPTPGEHTFNLWMREDGFPADKIVLTKNAAYDPASAGTFGPPQSPRGTPQPALVFDPPTLAFSADEGGAAPASQTVALDASDASGASFSLSWSAPWLTVSPSSGTTPASGLSVSVDPTGLSAGTYTETITATASAYLNGSLDVTFTVAGSTSPFQQDPTTGLVSMEVENVDGSTANGGHEWVAGTSSGVSGGASMVTTPNSGTNRNSDYVANSPRLDYRIDFLEAGTYYVWLRGQRPSLADDSVHAGVNGAGPATADRISTFSSAWSWSNATMDGSRATIDIPTPGEHTFNLWMREDGFPADKIVLTKNAAYDPASAGTFGPPQSPRGTPQPSLMFDTLSLDFSADEGGPAPASQAVALDASDASGASFSLSWSAPWLTVSPSSGTTPASGLSVSVDPTGLSAGTYTETITATATGYLNGGLDVTFTVAGSTSPFQQDPTTGLVSMEVENVDGETSQGGHSWVPGSLPGASGSASMVTTPNSGTNRNSNYLANSPRLDYQINFLEAGTYYVWLRGQGPSLADDSVHAGVDGTGPATADRISYFSNGGFSWSSDTMDGSRATIDIPTPGEHTFNLWMREDGFPADKIVLTKNAAYDPASAGTFGPPQSPRGTPQPALVFDPPTLAFSADEGGPPPASQAVALDASDASGASFTLSWSASWLTVSPSSGATPANGLLVSVDPAGLSAGTYTETITATASAYLNGSLDVTFTVVGDVIVSYDFDDNDATDWTPVEASGDPATWQAANGAFSQLDDAQSTISGIEDTYLQGTYAFLNAVSNLTDFEYSVVITPDATDVRRRGDGVGLHFRHVDDGNYYRLTVNSKLGFTRLERRIDGVMSTIAVTAEGYRFGEQLRLGVRISGAVILVYRDDGSAGSVFDNPPYLAAYDESLTSGTVAVYTQSSASFDDVVIGNLDGQMRIAVSAPAPFGVDADGEIDVQAVVLDRSGSESVLFELDGALCDAGSVAMPMPGLYTGSCVAAGPGEHSLEAVLSDTGGELERDAVTPIGTGGDETLSLGDSISHGLSDNFLADNIGDDILLSGVPMGPRQVAFRGYQARFHNEMTAAAGYGLPIIVFNEAVPGDTADDLAAVRIGSILERHPDATRALLMIGTNDANGGTTIADYQAALESVVGTLVANDIEPVLAVPPPVWGRNSRSVYTDPLNEAPNQRILGYAGAIATVNTNFGLATGPDFFARFLGNGENLISLFADNVHLTSAGQEVMGFEWKEHFAPGGVGPVYFADLCIRAPGPDCQEPTLYKQSILEVGNTYYIDRTYTITSIPPEVYGGVWLNPANNDKTNNRDDYIEFTVDQDVTVYIAVTATVTALPNWASGFVATGLSMDSTVDVGSLVLYSRAYSAGATVILGGNVAAGAAGTSNNNYVVILKAAP